MVHADGSQTTRLRILPMRKYSIEKEVRRQSKKQRGLSHQFSMAQIAPRNESNNYQSRMLLIMDPEMVPNQRKFSPEYFPNFYGPQFKA